MTQILDEMDNGRDMHSALKRHEAIHTDVEYRVGSVVFIVTVLLECFVNFVCSIRVIEQNSVMLMNSVICVIKFTYTNNFVVYPPHKCYCPL